MPDSSPLRAAAPAAAPGTPPTDPHHLLISYAACTAQGCQQVLADLPLPHLQALLARLRPEDSDPGSELDFALPHERALARALQLPTPATPWAAWEAAEGPEACAWISPCHWEVGAEVVRLLDPQALALSEAESRTLLAILAPWFEEDGIRLDYVAPMRWLARGRPFEGLETAALDRVQGRDVRQWMPRGPQAGMLHRLHSEMQMLLYTHGFNDARSERRLEPVNAFWVHGAGSLPQRPAPASQPCTDHRLRDAALREDWAAWRSAWSALDAGPIAELAARAAQGQAVRLTLCGERSAQSWASAPRSLWQQVQGLFGRKFLPDVLFKL
jgi:hypothetical protein